MISLVYGAKGSGKTKRIIEMANAAFDDAKGNVIYLTDNAKHSKEVRHEIRFVDVAANGIGGTDSMISFIKGMIAADNDIQKIYIDGLAYMCGKNVDDMQSEIKILDKLGRENQVDFVLTVSAEKLADFYKPYI